jgi:hypothetical protein
VSEEYVARIFRVEVDYIRILEEAGTVPVYQPHALTPINRI